MKPTRKAAKDFMEWVDDNFVPGERKNYMVIQDHLTTIMEEIYQEGYTLGRATGFGAGHEAAYKELD